MAFTNEVRLIGYCGDNPRSYDKADKKIVTVPVYTEHWWHDKLDNTHSEKNYHWCIFYGNNAVRAEKMLMKGVQVQIAGVLRYQKYKKADENKINAQIWVENFMISSKALMTKELYNQLFADDVLPYQVSLTLNDNNFDIEAVAKISILMQELNEEQIANCAFSFSFAGENILIAKNQPHCVVAQNLYSRVFKAIGLLPFKYNKELQAHTEIVVDKKPYFQGKLKLKDIIFVHIQI